MPDENESDTIKLMLVRLESKVDTVLARHEIRLDKQDDNHSDHEARVRSLEVAIHQLATKSDIEDIERTRGQQQEARQRKTMGWVMAALAVIVPIESAIVALLIQSIRS